MKELQDPHMSVMITRSAGKLTKQPRSLVNRVSSRVTLPSLHSYCTNEYLKYARIPTAPNNVVGLRYRHEVSFQHEGPPA